MRGTSDGKAAKVPEILRFCGGPPTERQEKCRRYARFCYICGKFLTFTTDMTEKDEKYIFGVVKVGDKGQIVIPRDARRQYDIKPGDALLLLGDNKGMALVKTEIFDSVVGQVMEGLTK